MGGFVSTSLSTADWVSQTKIHDMHLIKTLGPQSVEIGVAKPGEGRIRRSPSAAEIPDLNEKFGSVYPCMSEWLKSSCEKYASRNAIAYRPIKNEEKGMLKDETGKERPWTFINLEATQYFTYAQVQDMARRVGAGLAKLGIKGQDARVGLYEDTRYEWIVSLYGMWTQSVVGVTVYANLGEDALSYAVKESELVALFCGGKSVKNIAKLDLPSLKYIFVYDAVPEGAAVPAGVQIITFEELLKAEPIESLMPTSSDVALIMYTSGTTGDPKGVVMTHKNLVAAVETLNRRVVPSLGAVPLPDETYVAYLPLAHILELTAENVFFTRGSCVCYGNPRTLTDTSARPHGDLKEFKPTIFAGVPRIYDTIKKAIETKLPPAGSLKRKVFDRAYADRAAALKKGLDTPYWNKKVFAQFHAVFGGKVKMMVSGGAPLNTQTHEFMMIIFGCSMQQGYGLTETCAMGTTQRQWDAQLGIVGGVGSGCEIKFRDAGEWSSNVSGRPQQGEVCIRGPCVTQGYFKQPEKTAEVYGTDGWFATGDVGEWQKDGTLKIIGRVKALAKNAHGEYIAMEVLESVYAGNELIIPNGACVIVDSDAAYIGAIVLTDEKKAMAFAKQHKLEGAFPEILQTKEFRAKVVESFAETAKSHGRKPFEYVKSVRVYADEWTPENGILTAAMKLKRREIDKKYAEEIKEMFKA